MTTSFKYDRNYPPLFFRKPNAEEKEIWNKSMSSVTREYFKMSREHNVGPDAILSNGASFGEYGMWLITMNHRKRSRTKSKQFK